MPHCRVCSSVPGVSLGPGSARARVGEPGSAPCWRGCGPVPTGVSVPFEHLLLSSLASVSALTRPHVPPVTFLACELLSAAGGRGEGELKGGLRASSCSRAPEGRLVSFTH